MILALRALGLGDLLTVVPAVRALRRNRPDGELVVAAPTVLGPLVARIGGVDALLPVASAVDRPPGPVPVAGRRPRLAVNLHGRGPESTRALAALRPGSLWAYQIPGGPPWREREHERDRWCRLLSWYGCPADPDDVLLGVGSADGPVLLHPGAADPARCWPVERFAAVARALADHEIVITGSRAELGRARTVAQSAGLPARCVRAGGTDLADLADLVASARLVVCGDTGVAHLASAYRTPSVLLFGPATPQGWGPPARGPHTVLWHPPDVRNIGVPEVVAAAQARLSRPTAVVPTTTAQYSHRIHMLGQK